MNKTISIVFLASAALHAAVLGLIHFDSPQPLKTGSEFRVSIQASSPASNGENPDSQRQAVAPEEKQNPTSNIADSIPSTEEQTTSTAVTKPEMSPQVDKTNHNKKIVTAKIKSVPAKKLEIASASANTANTPSSNQSIQLSQKTVSLLQADLEKSLALYFQYPRLAIKRGWQGEVQLFIRIEADGRLTSISLLQSSGYELLDKSAMKSVKSIEVLPEAIVLLHGKSFDLILPVRYILL